jgi:caffeoyl-CoA O-methyltransferase
MLRNALDEIYSYSDHHSSEEDLLLNELERKTYLAALSPQMVSGKLQGKFLSFISNLIKPNFVLDIGSFTGYSSLCFASGLTEDGAIHTIDVNEDYEHIRHAFFERHAKAKQIIQHIGDAERIIPNFNNVWDIVFIDANKKAYLNYYHLLKNKIRPGGLLIADNVLWSGKVLDKEKDAETTIIDEYNKTIVSEGLFDVTLFPLRDGISVAVKK